MCLPVRPTEQKKGVGSGVGLSQGGLLRAAFDCVWGVFAPSGGGF